MVRIGTATCGCSSPDDALRLALGRHTRQALAKVTARFGQTRRVGRPRSAGLRGRWGLGKKRTGCHHNEPVQSHRLHTGVPVEEPARVLVLTHRPDRPRLCAYGADQVTRC
jgi:hypothetical protein